MNQDTTPMTSKATPLNQDFTSNELAEIRSRALGMLRKATGKSECAALKSLITSASKMQACLVQEEAQNQINEAAQMTLEDAAVEGGE